MSGLDEATYKLLLDARNTIYDEWLSGYVDEPKVPRAKHLEKMLNRLDAALTRLTAPSAEGER